EQLVEQRADALPVARRVLHGASAIERRRDVTPKRRPSSAGRCRPARDGCRGDERPYRLGRGGSEDGRGGAEDGDEDGRDDGDRAGEAGTDGGFGAHGGWR